MARQVLPCSILKAYYPKLDVSSLKMKNNFFIAVLLLKETQLFIWPVSDGGYAGMARQMLPCSLLKAFSPKLNVSSLKSEK